MTVAGPTQTKANFATRAGLVKVSTPRDQWIDQVSADHRLQRIAGGDQGRRYKGTGGGGVGGKGADQNRRPDAQPAQKHGGERDSGRRPDRAGARIDRGELQAELGEDEIGDRDRVSRVPR